MTLHLGRWQDTLPGTYDPATAVVITDPPFGIGRSAYVDEIKWADHVREVLELLPAARHVIRGSAPLIAAMDIPPPRRIHIEVATYRKGGMMPGMLPYAWHGWLIYGRLRIGRRRFVPTRDWFPIQPYDSTMGGPASGAKHDGRTPYQSCATIVETWTEPGWTVIDPFAGIGTIGQAAGAFGHGYIGSEMDERWHRRAVGILASGTVMDLAL